ncbi:flagellar basal body P-ring formation chaperone FlgA [Photobacterium sp. 1_MG-2023]|uniref:flagellar basal body P-ring formation chaperone FlgA n=1 Tax=Photobacterium sp. 1_MG-2023 TaxID=3062646 RepID=UPI0026E12F24|nr:flagellar basal body P-ring formation chaperone FlgA [Photobacterium sp. 1_MG-2023]MDO6705218.1 flagellar basal body P-ring formation chaperone FlgA [Photobacterium sp. 1_MG-2023]
MTERTHFTLRLIFIGILCGFLSGNAIAASDNLLSNVRQAATDHIRELVAQPDRGSLEVNATALDNRLRITECQEPLQTSVPGNQSLTGNVTVLVSCPTSGWQVYVPVQVSLLLPRVVAAKPLARGTVLTADDLQVSQVESRFQRSIVFESPEQVIGSTVKRNINMGEAVEGNDICLVCRNDSVIIKAGQSGLNIVTKGTALSDGSLGEEIRVQNTKSRRIIQARITAVGEVTVSY